MRISECGTCTQRLRVRTRECRGVRNNGRERHGSS